MFSLELVSDARVTDIYTRMQQILDFANNKLESFGSDGSGLLYTLDRQLRSVRTRADDVANWPNVRTQ